jgi:hypothetical protein
VYDNVSDGPDWQTTNERRFAVLRYQLGMYARDDISWSIWLWKDIGFQGMVYVNEDTPYIRLIKPFLAKKKVSLAKVW